MPLLQAIVLAALQGITELFPISSLGHGTILPKLFARMQMIKLIDKSMLVRSCAYCIVAVFALAARPGYAADGLWIAKTQTVARQVIAYGTVEPRAVLRVRAGVAGTLRDFSVLPGDVVTAGASLGHLAGAPVDALLASRQSALAGAEAQLKAAQQALAIARQNLTARLNTRDVVDRAEAAVKQAQAARNGTQANLKAAQSMVLVRAPRAGRVLTLGATAGERVQPGETILTLLPNHALWLRAVYYGNAANRVRVGMSGVFAPAGGDVTIPVKVRAIVGALRADGGRTVSLVATSSEPGWLDGEAGTVTIDAGKVTGVAVPTSALILDQANWWIVVHTAKGDEPQRVAPGPRWGALTLIEHGLTPGTAVVVANAYLEFHRGISAHYQPPD